MHAVQPSWHLVFYSLTILLCPSQSQHQVVPVYFLEAIAWKQNKNMIISYETSLYVNLPCNLLPQCQWIAKTQISRNYYQAFAYHYPLNIVYNSFKCSVVYQQVISIYFHQWHERKLWQNLREFSKYRSHVLKIDQFFFLNCEKKSTGTTF